MDDPYNFWSSIIASALAYGRLDVMKEGGSGEIVPRPESSGLFKRSFGEMKGQMADWRASIKGSTRGIHAVEYEDRYSVHVDRHDPYKEPLKHIILDSPKTTLSLLATGLISALFIGLFGRRR